MFCLHTLQGSCCQQPLEVTQTRRKGVREREEVLGVILGLFEE